MNRLRHLLPAVCLNAFLVLTGVELLWVLSRQPFSHGTGIMDFAWLALAAVNVQLALLRRDPRVDAWGALVVAGGGLTALLVVDVWLARPFGHREYLGTMGPQAGPLPLAMPLLAWAVVGGLHYLLCRWLRHRPRVTLAALTALGSAAFFWLIDPAATYHRAWWQWMAGTQPASHPVAWAGATFVLCLLAPWAREPFSRVDPRPAWVVGGLGLTFLAERIASGL